ncbi:MAG: lipocalin-like domain-containing protein [Ginsengibacter sp.]
MIRLFLVLMVMMTSVRSYSQNWKVYPYKPGGSLISFPADEGHHTTEPIEWWYTAGHLAGAQSGKTYSYMLTYFYYPASSYGGFRILNITDETTGIFYQDAKLVRYTALSTTHLDIHASVTGGDNEFWTTKTDSQGNLIPFEYNINAASSAAGFQLDYISTKRPLILADSGYLKEGLANYTYYYSQTTNQVSGELTLNGITENVTGTSWIDRQYGDFDRLMGEKYEWFFLQLSNGMDINVWNVFTANNKLPANSKYRILSSYVNDNTQYTTSDFKIERLGFNWMPDSQMCYSNKWRLTSPINKIDITFSTKDNNNEVQFPFRFFEGATDVSGTVNGVQVTGFGFAELLHSYESPSIKITYPDTGSYDIKKAISWHVQNPDEGNPLSYDLYYSVNNKESFIPIATSIRDTFYLWNNATIGNQTKIWFKIVAHSIDKKLQGTAISENGSTIITGKSNRVIIYPNPATDFIYFAPEFELNNPECIIVNESGQLVAFYKANSLTSKIDVSFLPKGIYFLKMGDEKKIVRKFIKH